MMKASIAVLAVAASFAAAAETNEVESAESSAFFVEASVDVLSDYIWRGKTTGIPSGSRASRSGTTQATSERCPQTSGPAWT